MGPPQRQAVCPSRIHGKGWAVSGNLPSETGSQQRKALWVTDESHPSGVNIVLRRSLTAEAGPVVGPRGRKGWLEKRWGGMACDKDRRPRL